MYTTDMPTTAELNAELDPDVDPRAHGAIRLTEREAALYALAREETVRDLADELARFAPPEDDGTSAGFDFLRGYRRAMEIVTDLQKRIARLGPAPALPDAPCSLPGWLDSRPVLCGYNAGHQDRFPCSWAAGPAPAQPETPPEPTETRRSFPVLGRLIASGLIGALEELRDSME